MHASHLTVVEAPLLPSYMHALPFLCVCMGGIEWEVQSSFCTLVIPVRRYVCTNLNEVVCHDIIHC